MNRKLAIFFLINTIAINALLIFGFSTWWKETVLYDTAASLMRPISFFSSLTVEEHADSWDSMIPAFLYLQAPNDQSVYSEIFFERRIRFQYPPTSLLMFYLLKPWAVEQWPVVLNGAFWFLLPFTAFFVMKVFQHAAGATGTENRSARIVLLLGFILTFYPLVKAFSLGQIQTLVNALFALHFWLFLKGKEGGAGATAGLMCLIKPQYLILLLWAALRRKNQMLVYGFAVTVTGLVISLAVFGFQNHLDYLNVLGFLSRHGESYYQNQSVNGLLHRLLGNGQNLYWQQHEFPPFDPLVYAGTLFSSALLLIAALWLPSRTKSAGSIIDFSLIAVTATIASPIAWQHHYGILLPIFAFLFPAIVHAAISVRSLPALLCISYALCSNYYKVTQKFASAPMGLNVMQSYILFGTLLMLAVLYYLAFRKPKIAHDAT